jgi:uncharacterized membrane protein YhaH (DUF805 family)
VGDWLKLFLSPQGRIGRRSFWLGWLVLTVINLCLYIGLRRRLPHYTGGSAPLFNLAPIATIYFTICLYAKRLRDIGRSVWLQAPGRVAWAVALVTVAMPGSWTNGPAWASGLKPGVDLLVFAAAAIGFTADFVLFVWSGFWGPAMKAAEPARA